MSARTLCGESLAAAVGGVIFETSSAQPTKNHQRQQQKAQTLLFHLTTVWLFTRSDIKTIWAPATGFGIANALAGSQYGIAATHDLQWILLSTLLSGTWVWLQLLPFSINNQRHADSIAEDAVNKPWRPLPSKRISPEAAKTLQLLLHVVAVVYSARVGGFAQCLGGLALGAWYNQFGGSDRDYVTRNLINALGFLCFVSGALEVALRQPLPWSTRLVQWLLIVAGTVFTTVQSQDLYDQVGDKARGRQTMPLVIGDALTRWTIAWGVLFWSALASWFWSCRGVVAGPALVLAAIVAGRTLHVRAVDADKRTFRVWNAWVAYLYFMPLLNSL